MPNIRVEIDITGYVEEVDQARNRDIPFVTAKALTRTAQDAQTEVRRNIQKDFTLRNHWTQQGVKITPAEKLSWPITAEVYTDTGNNSGAPDYLVRQDEGGEKVPFGGRQHLAIPTKYLRAVAPRTIPEALRPRHLLPPEAEIGKAYRGTFASGGEAKRYNQVSKKGLRTLGSAEFAAFLQVDHRGTLCIFVRPGGSKRDAQPWYVLISEATVRPVLEFQPTVLLVVEQRFETHWDDAWAELA